MKGGLKPLARSEADLKLGAFFSQPKLGELPREYIIPAFNYYHPKNQGDTDFCSAFATTTAMEATEGVTLSPEWFFAASKFLTDDPDEWGQDLRAAGNCAVKMGALEQDEAPYSLSTNSADFLRRFANWGDTTKQMNKAIFHKQKSYSFTKGGFDGFDNLRAWIWKFRQPVVMGVEWGWPPDRQYITEQVEGYGHAIVAVGWTVRDSKEFLVIQNSWGMNGDEGKFYMSKDVVNGNVSRYGAIMFTDLSVEEARYYQENGLSAERNWLLNLIIQTYKVTLGTMIEQIKKLTNSIDDQKLITMALAMKEFEGWVEPGMKGRDGKIYPDGSLSFRNNNPGNLKWSKFMNGTKNGHAYFDDYETGWKALLFQIEIAFDGRSSVYKPTDTIADFFRKYCEANQKEYAGFVCQRLRVEVSTPLSEALKKT